MSGSIRSEAPAASAGFTLIEVVVALAVIAVMLTSIGALVGATVRGSHALDEHLALIETVRALEADTDRTALKPGTIAGETTGLRWRVDVAPFVNAAGIASRWEPVIETISVRAARGTTESIATVRLRLRPPP